MPVPGACENGPVAIEHQIGASPVAAVTVEITTDMDLSPFAGAPVAVGHPRRALVWYSNSHIAPTGKPPGGHDNVS